MFRLVRLQPDPRDPGSDVHACDEDNVVVGRQPGRGLVLDDPTISREHARIFRRDEGYSVADLNSSNGTFVNGRRVTRAELQPGDRITFGSVEFRFERAAAEPGPAAAGTSAASEITLEEPVLEEPGAAPAGSAGPVDLRPDATRVASPFAAPPPPRRLVPDRMVARDATRRPSALTSDLAQYNPLVRAIFVVLALAVAIGIFLGVMKLTETVVPEGEVEGTEIVAPQDGG